MSQLNQIYFDVKLLEIMGITWKREPCINTVLMNDTNTVMIEDVKECKDL